ACALPPPRLRRTSPADAAVTTTPAAPACALGRCRERFPERPGLRGPGPARVRRRWSRVRRAQDKEPRPRLASPDGGWQRPPRLRPDKPVQLRSAGIRGWLRCQRRLAWLYPEITYLSLPGIRSTRRLAAAMVSQATAKVRKTD